MKTKTCQRCEVPTPHDATLDDLARPVWKCRCCGHNLHRVVRQSAKQRKILATLKTFANL